jgi:hypothetical protein
MKEEFLFFFNFSPEILYCVLKIYSLNKMNTDITGIYNSNTSRDLCARHGLNVSSLTWEDTGRWKNSCVGPNISDMTLLTKCSTCPIITNTTNYKDKTNDVAMSNFTVVVGNEKNNSRTRISLKEYLENISSYLPNCREKFSLFANRDTHVLCKSQCCVLPLNNGSVEFAVNLYNYQSQGDESAVLTVVASQHGTSSCLVSRGKSKLYFNDNGTARWFSAKRLADVRSEANNVNNKINSFSEMTTEEKADNILMVFQIPLVIKNNSRMFECSFECSAVSSNSKSIYQERSRGMDFAQIGTGSSDGQYPMVNRVLVRDENFPIRCTYQYYRVTDMSELMESDVSDISKQLSQVERFSTSSGSLVTEISNRVTEPIFNNVRHIMPLPLAPF